jgi:hypothetical protein
LPVGSLPSLAGGKIAWSPNSKMAASVGVALTGETAQVVTVGTRQYLDIGYAAGSVASGSFASTSGVGLSVTRNATLSSPQKDCASGSHAVAFHGSLTL